MALLFVAYIAVMAGFNYKMVTDPFAKFFNGGATFEETTSTVASGYQSDQLWGKTNFIDLNGFFARATARRAYNGVTLLKNNMLSYEVDQFQKFIDISYLGSGISDFSDYLASIGIPFVYVQLPIKQDQQGSVLPDGLKNYPNINADAVVKKLVEAGTNTLDIRPELAGSAAMLKENFYKTDHHWNADGAFKGYQLIMDHLNQNVDSSIRAAYTDPSLWQRHVLEDWFLGSHGKRVGRYFDGTDDLIWYTPDFKTEISCIIPLHKNIFKGTFKDANIRSIYTEQKDYFRLNPYAIYIGGDYPLTQHRNAKAPNQMRVLLIKDSFMLPLQSFLSTEFTEIDVIDPRYYTASTIAEYCAWNRPDLVIMAKNPSIGDRRYCQFGVDDAKKEDIANAPETVLLSDYDVDIEKKDFNWSSSVIPVEMVPGKTYRFRAGDITVTDGHTDGVSVLLFDSPHNEIVLHEILDVGYCKENVNNGRREWTFKVPRKGKEGALYKLVIYAGVHGSTKNTGISYSDISVTQLG